MHIRRWLSAAVSSFPAPFGAIGRGKHRRSINALQLSELLEDRTLLAAFTVNTSNDTIDANHGDGIAADTNGQVSLRAAIMEANALQGADTISVPAGTYTIALAGSEDAAAAGDLGITEAVTITGAGITTVINGAKLDRVFDAPVTSNIIVELNSLRITNGNSDFGGGIRSRVDMRLNDIVIDNNESLRRGAGVFSTRHLTITDSAIRDNTITGV